jgi:hypothetical protein
MACSIGLERGAQRFVTDDSTRSGQDKRSCATTIATSGRSSGLRVRDWLTKGKVMTAEELASYIELLVMEGRASGLSDETMASQLQDAADALREGVS